MPNPPINSRDRSPARILSHAIVASASSDPPRRLFISSL